MRTCEALRTMTGLSCHHQISNTIYEEISNPPFFLSIRRRFRSGLQYSQVKHSPSQIRTKTTMRHYHISTRTAKITTMENSKYWRGYKATHFGKLLAFINIKTKHICTLWTSSLICWRRDRLPTPVFLGFPCGSARKESACNAGNLDSIPRLGRSLAEEKGYPPQ